MKNIILILSLMIVFASCNNHSQSDNSEKTDTIKMLPKSDKSEVCYTIGDQYAGEFVIGNQMPEQDELEGFTMVKTESSIQMEGEVYEEIYYTISEGNEDILTIKPSILNMDGEDLEIIEEIIVKSNKYKTSLGIAVGSTIEDFLTAYPDYKIWYSYVGELYVIESGEIDAQFLLSGDDFTGTIENLSDMVFLKPEDFKAGSKIQKIRLI